MGSERGMISTKGLRNVGGVTCDILVAASHHAAWHMSHRAGPPSAAVMQRQSISKPHAFSTVCQSLQDIARKPCRFDRPTRSKRRTRVQQHLLLPEKL